MLRIGQSVVCVDDGMTALNNERLPKKGVVYTVRDHWITHDGTYGIRLFEIVNRAYRYSDFTGECYFDGKNFRPIIERKTDISIFTQMLKRLAGHDQG